VAHPRQETHASPVTGSSATFERALGYGSAVRREFMLNEGISPQCVHELRCIDIAACVLGIHEKDKVQEFDVLVTPLELDRVGVGEVPIQKTVERNDTIDQGGELPAQIRK
jgi:hypothetical protein